MSEQTQEPQVAREETALVKIGDSGLSMAGLAEVFVRSGFFKDVRQQSQAIVKVLYGQELGLKPIQAMLSIHMVEGKPVVESAAMGAMVRRSGKYDYRITEHTPDACEIEFFSVHNGTREALGSSRFTWEDAKTAGLAGKFNWKAYPKNMLFARAMSNGVKWHCLDAVGGVAVYTEGDDFGEPQPGRGGPEAVPTVEEFNEFMPKEVPAPQAAPPTPESPAAVHPAGDGAGQGVKPGATVNTARRGRKGPVETVQASVLQEPTPAQATVEGATARQAQEPEKGEEAPAEAALAEAEPPTSPEEASDDPLEVEPATTQKFTIGTTAYETKGLTRAQMLQLFELRPAVDRAKGKGTAKGVRDEMYPGIPSSTDLTEAQGAALIGKLEALLK